MPITVIYHADCPDGFGAAYAAWRQFGNAARYLPLHHGQPWNPAEIAGHDLYILDFSFPPAVLSELAGTAKSVTQIDHHVSARQDWAGLLQPDGTGREIHRDPQLPLTVVFNLHKSGARLAWEHFQPGQPLPLVLAHVEDLDLWRFALPGTRAFSHALRQLPFDFASWHELAETLRTDAPRYREMLARGDAIEAFLGREIERLATGSLTMPAHLRGEPVDAVQALRHGQAVVSDGDRSWLAVTGIAINASALFTSALGHRLAERSGNFCLIWQLAGDGEIKASLRSQGSFDVAGIAARYGGGGHVNAAGFRMAPEPFFSEVLGLR